MMIFGNILREIKNVLELSEGALIAIIFFAVVLFVFMIYVGICVIKIKNDLRTLTKIEMKKQMHEAEEKKEKKEKEDEDLR